MLTAQTSIREYFREALGTAMRDRAVRLTDEAQVYLVHLLCEFARSENAFAGTDHGDKPALALMLQRAQEAEPTEAVRIYKHMGDSSLYLTGFFADSQAATIVSRDYYLSMGETAYSSVASFLRGSAATSSALFAELADQFTRLVDLLSAVSLHGEKSSSEKLSDEKLLELVDRYRRTGNAELLEALKAHGVVLRPGVQGGNNLIN